MTIPPAELNRLRRRVTILESQLERLQNDTQILTCVYCGEAYPPGTPNSNSEALNEHIQHCSEHPLAKGRRAIDNFRIELVDKGADFGVIAVVNEALDRFDKAINKDG